MKIVVTRRNGSTETIHLSKHARVVRGEQLNRFSDYKTEQFFDKDGYYDGWGSYISEDDMRGIVDGINDMADGQVKSLAQIDAELELAPASDAVDPDAGGSTE